MQYLKFTYVDAQTGIPCTEAPMLNGPAFPAVEGLEFGFALESEYPIACPTFFGTAPDNTSVDAAGVQGIVSETDYQAAFLAEMTTRRGKVVVSMRQARLALLNAGLLDQVDVAIAAIDDAVDREAARVTWEYAIEVKRLDPWVIRLGTALGLNDAALDGLFALALGL